MSAIAIPQVSVAAPATPSPAAATAAPAAAPANDSVFHDLLEVINPLQHIPIVSTLYRAATGDKIGTVERIAGDTLYGGVLGLASSVANVVFQQLTGKDFGDTAMAMLGINIGAKETAVAANDSHPTSATPDTQASRPAIGSAEQIFPALVDMRVATARKANASNEALASARSSDHDSGTTANSTEAVATASSPISVSSQDLLKSLNVDTPTLALNVPTPSTPASAPIKIGAVDDKSSAALLASLDHDGFDAEMGQRALYAYRRTMSLPAGAFADAAPQP